MFLIQHIKNSFVALSWSTVSLAESGLSWIPDNTRKADFTFPFLIYFETDLASFLVWSSPENVLVNFCWMVLPSSSKVGMSPCCHSDNRLSRHFMWSFTFDLLCGFWRSRWGITITAVNATDLRGVDSPNALSNLDDSYMNSSPTFPEGIRNTFLFLLKTSRYASRIVAANRSPLTLSLHLKAGSRAAVNGRRRSTCNEEFNAAELWLGRMSVWESGVWSVGWLG